MSQRGTSCANLYAVAVQHDKLYNAPHCKSKCAFTLAEVLITLVIIGVIAALTIPNLMQKYTEQTTVKKVQKFYSNLSNAYQLAMKENGSASNWRLEAWTGTSAEKIYEILLKPYFKIAKDCGRNNTGNCLANVKYKYLDNSDGANYASLTQSYMLALDDGSVIWVSSGNQTYYQIFIFFDINGKNGPNQWGKDLFTFAIKNEQAFPVGIPYGAYSLPSSSFNSNCKINGTGDGCAAWIIYKGNMDYLHCDGLTWNSRSCKDK